MRIEYELEPQDWAAFAEYHARHSTEWRRVARGVAFGGAFLIVMISGLVASAAISPAWLIAGIVLGLSWIWYWPRHLIRHAREHALAQERPCLSGRHVMEARADGLYASCDVTESVVRWPGVTEIISTPDHVFVMLGPSKGYSVAKQRLLAGDVESFVATASALQNGA